MLPPPRLSCQPYMIPHNRPSQAPHLTIHLLQHVSQLPFLVQPHYAEAHIQLTCPRVWPPLRQQPGWKPGHWEVLAHCNTSTCIPTAIRCPCPRSSQPTTFACYHDREHRLGPRSRFECPTPTSHRLDHPSPRRWPNLGRYSCHITPTESFHQTINPCAAHQVAPSLLQLSCRRSRSPSYQLTHPTNPRH